MKVFSVLVLCLCTGSFVAQGAASTAVVEAAPPNAAPDAAAPGAASTTVDAAAPAVADAGAKRALNFPIPDRGHPHRENRGYYVPHCDECPRERQCTHVDYEKSYCYVSGDPRCHPLPHSGCKGKGYYSVRWYYSNSAGRCFRFLYKGGPRCGDSKNNFHSKEECESACARRRPYYYHDNGNDHGYNDYYEPRRPGRRYW